MGGRCDSTLDSVIARASLSAAAEVTGAQNAVISAVTHDSRAVGPHSLFLCFRGASHDGHSFAEEAIRNGASALVVDHRLDLDVPQVVVSDVRRAAGPLSCAVYGHPSRRMRVIGVTGTNGKTTTVTLIAAILEHVGRPASTIGTLTGALTTPEAPVLQARLAALADAGITDVVMEVSSHALDQHRVDGTGFAAAVFTNLTQDHLDLHGTMEAYFAAKARLFQPMFTTLGIVNHDDPWGRRLEGGGIRTVPFSAADATGVEVHPHRVRLRWRGRVLEVPIGGAFNVSNVLAAATTASALGIDEQEIVEALATVSPVPGRFESIRVGQPFHVIVDYAHTPDGLRSVLATARSAASDGRLVVVFGCGGDRDRAKRPLMGAVAVEGADLVIVTSDNPRSEDPMAIIDDIVAGIATEGMQRVRVEQDRSIAIETALRIAHPGDVVVVAGKGHETTQTIGDQVIEFDDRDVARRVLERLR